MQKINKKLMKKYLAMIMVGACALSVASTVNVANAAGTSNNSVVKNQKIIEKETIGKGIEYTKKQLNITGKKSNLKEVVNIVKLDLNDKDIKIITSKAQDKVRALENLTKQIEREATKSNNVIAGINGDMYYNRNFINVGPQVRQGKLLLSYDYKEHEKTLPVFAINADGRALIDNMSFEGKVKCLENNCEININLVNREPRNSQLMVYTRDYSRDGSIDFSKLKGNTSYVVVEPYDESMKLDETTHGRVKTVIKGNKNYVIKDKSIVIAANGVNARKIEENFKVGSEVEVKVGFNRKGIIELMGGYNYLVKNGRALSEQQMIGEGAEKFIVCSRGKARTAVGITEDNKLVAITVDGGKASSGISNGLTLPEMARVMENEKVVVSMSLDGGGSTQMNVRKFDQNSAAVVNRPSDGRERSITNALLFLSTAPKTEVAGRIEIGQDIIIFKNSRYKFNIKAADTNFNKMQLNSENTNWDCNNLGTVDDGVFTAKDGAGQGKIVVSSGEAKAQVNVQVLDSIPCLSLRDKSPVIIGQGANKKFAIDMKTKDGKKIIIDDKFITWNVSGNIGVIDEKGLFKANSSKGKGKVIVNVGNKSCSVDVQVGKDPMVIEGFEHNQNARYKVNGYVGGKGTITTEQKKSGRYSYKVTYDCGKNWTRVYNGTTNIIPTFKDAKGKNITSSYTTNVKPNKIGVWVYGDGKSPWMRAIVKDKKGKNYTIDLAKNINWKGWKYVQANIPQNISSPVQLSYIYIVETNKKSHNKGCIYIDDIMFVY